MDYVQRNIFQKIQKQRHIQKEKECNIAAIALIDNDLSVVMAADQKFTTIDTLFYITKEKQKFEFSHDKKPKTFQKINVYSLFIGFMKLEDMYLIFAESVYPLQYKDKFIYQISRVEALSLKKLKRNKDLSYLLTIYMHKNFIFSYDIDLTYSDNFRNQNQTKNNNCKFDWFYFANRNCIISCLLQNQKWAVPIIRGNVHSWNIEIDGKKQYLTFFYKQSIMNLNENYKLDFVLSREVGLPEVLCEFMVMIDNDVDQQQVLRFIFPQLPEFECDFLDQQSFDYLPCELKKLDILNYTLFFSQSYEKLYFFFEENHDLEAFEEFKKNVKFYVTDNKNIKIFFVKEMSPSQFNKTLIDNSKDILETLQKNKIFNICFTQRQCSQVISDILLRQIQSTTFTILDIQDSKDQQKVESFLKFFNDRLNRQQEHINYKFKLEFQQYLQKQKIVNLNLDKFFKAFYGSSQSILRSMRKLYTKKSLPIYSFQQISITILIHNCGGLSPNDDIKINYLDNEYINDSDLIVLGLQEIVEMKSKNFTKIVTNDNEEMVNNWCKFLQQKLSNYLLIAKASMLGLLTVVFLKKNIKNVFNVNVVQHQLVKLGKFGMANKGGVYIELKINGEELGFINCHLEAGNKQEKNKKRFKALKEFYDLIKKKTHLTGAFIFGDMNFRNQNTCENIQELFQQFKQSKDQSMRYQIINKLKTTEDFTQQMQNDDVQKELQDIKEMNIHFLPTYKKTVGSKLYDYQNGKRPPSWTDRILIVNNDLKGFQNIIYNADLQTIFSDHTQLKKTGFFEMLIQSQKIRFQEYQTYLQINVISFSKKIQIYI